MTDLLVVVILLVIVVLAVLYIRKQKMSGAKCIGCPHSGKCGSSCSCTEKDKT